MPRIKSVIALIALFAVAVPPSAIAENRNRERTSSIWSDGLSARRSATSAAEVILAAMNRERTARGLRPLRLNQKLSLAANDRIGDMFSKRYFAHVSPDGLQPFTWARQRGYRYRLIGENLAVGYRGKSVVDGWMNSRGHRENILQRGFDEVGIAIADGAPQRGYRGPTVVAMYGTPASSR